MVVNTLAPVLPERNQLPHLRARMESAHPRATHPDPNQVQPYPGECDGQMGTAVLGGLDDVVLVQWVCSTGCISEWKDLLWNGKSHYTFLVRTGKQKRMNMLLTRAQVCDVARASTAISAVSWLVWTITFVIGVIRVVKGGNMRFGKKAPVGKEVDMHQGV